MTHARKGYARGVPCVPGRERRKAANIGFIAATVIFIGDLATTARVTECPNARARTLGVT